MPVFLYALSTCFHCKRTKEFLRENNIPFDFVDVDLAKGETRERLAREVEELTGGRRFPVIKIGEECIVGFQEEKLRELLIKK